LKWTPYGDLFSSLEQKFTALRLPAGNIESFDVLDTSMADLLRKHVD
jgi:hypothetical protein